MRNIYKLKINYHEYTFNKLSEAVELLYDFDMCIDDYEITVARVTEEGEPVAEAIRTGLNADYPQL